MSHETCDICLGTGKTLKGDQCICKNGSTHGLLDALRIKLFDQTRVVDSLLDDNRKRTELLRDVHRWLVWHEENNKEFDGTGKTLKDKIRYLLHIS